MSAGEVRIDLPDGTFAMLPAVESVGKVDALARPPGHCANDEAWQQFANDPRYASPSRDGLTMGDLSDFDLANRQFMADRSDLMLGAFQTAAKERIRWLSIQLAAALAGAKP